MTIKAKGSHGRAPTGMVTALQRLRLTPELNDALLFVSIQTGLSKNAIVREALAQWAFRIGVLPRVDVPITNYRKETA